ncbi:MAG: hypothetical protein ABIK07_24740, partial [Planctomycetota bacterium]
MTNQSELIIEFDRVNRILHLSARTENRVKSKSQLEALCQAAGQALDKYSSGGRCYMIVDVSMIVIEPELVEPYAEKVQEMYDRYLFPDGLARYGHQITRITARL